MVNPSVRNLNAGLSIKYEQRISVGIDGVGLYRTEIPFMLQKRFSFRR